MKPPSYCLTRPCSLIPRWITTIHVLNHRQYATTFERPFRLAIIGSGPAGFYSAYRVMAKMSGAVVDMYERLPVPFGLVRFGVAPDHPEVKNCQDKFTEVAASPRFNFIGNVDVGVDVSLSNLRNEYDAILFAYGASKDRELGIPGEHLKGIYSARSFVGWYNGLPEYANLSPDLESGDTAVVVGQGNVALDVARILLSSMDRLRASDITENALDALSRSKIIKVHVIGRRGPLQASFTIKELRELIQLPDVQFRPVEEDLLPGPDIKLPRAPKRITDLLKKHSSSSPYAATTASESRTASLEFLRSPVQFNSHPEHSTQLHSVTLARNIYDENANRFEPNAKVRATNRSYELETALAFRSIGYKSEPLPGMDDLGIAFDMRSGTIPNNFGRVLGNGAHIPGLYCAGWVKRGPTGVIASTMEDAFTTAEIVVSDWTNKSQNRPGWEALRKSLPHAVTWQDWLRIDAAEKSIGKAKGKPREKFKSVEDMLNVVH